MSAPLTREEEKALRKRMAEPLWPVFSPDADFEIGRLLATIDRLRGLLDVCYRAIDGDLINLSNEALADIRAGLALEAWE